MMKIFKNKRTDEKLTSISSESSLHNQNNDLTIRSKFNFSFIDTSQTHGSDFSDISKENLCTLLNHIKEHGKKSLEQLSREGIGKGAGGKRNRSCILEIYGDFPSKEKTYFREPSYIPCEVRWGRFRFGSKYRLIGFIIPPELHGVKHPSTGENFDKNTFYVVFLDMEHKFYSPH